MNAHTSYRENSIHWIIKSSYYKNVINVLKSGIFQSTDTANIVKSNPVRTVKTITLEGGCVLYCKHYNAKGWRDLVKYTVFGSKAKREWTNGIEILKRNIFTGEPVAYGEKKSNGFTSDNFLLIKAVPQSKPLGDILSDNEPENILNFKERRMFLKRLTLFLADLHSKGILHKDIHTGNILVHTQIYNFLRKTDYEAQIGKRDNFSIIDLHDVHCKTALSTSCKINNLAFLLYSLTQYCSRTELFFVMKCYLKGCFADFDEKKVVKEINRRMIGTKRKHMLSRTKRCLNNSSAFAVQSWKCKEGGNYNQGKYKVFFRRSYDRKTIEDAITSHNSAKQMNSDCVIKDTSRVFVTAIPMASQPDDCEHNAGYAKLCVKEYINPNIFRQIREYFLSSRAERAWYAANGFIVRKLITPLPVAMLERIYNGRLISSFILTEFIEHAIPVYLYVTNPLNNSCQIAGVNTSKPDEHKSNVNIAVRRKLFIESFSRSFKNLHKANVYHADLKGGNILVKEIGENKWKFFYLDLDTVSFKKVITESEIIKNLTQLNASLPNDFSFSDRVRFFKNYTGRGKLTQYDKLLIRKIVKASIKRSHLWKHGKGHSYFMTAPMSKNAKNSKMYRNSKV